MSQAVELFICSSRRHLYQAAGLAHGREASCHLLVVDQPSEQADATVAALAAEPGLFASVQVQAKHKKRRQFRANLTACAALVEAFQPQRIYVGNDRKYAFQYAMKCALAQSPQCRGVYMDDGTGSYESGIYLSFWRGLVDRTVVAWAKRLAVGWWYQRTRYFGGSRWVHECLVQHPDLLPTAIRRSKAVHQLSADRFRNEQTLRMLQRCFLAASPEGWRWTACEAIVILPLVKHPERHSAALQSFLKPLRQATAGASSVGIKYHPRQQQAYFPAGENDLVVERDIPAEILFSMCRPKLIVGDTSSALLSAQWLQTQADIVSLCPQQEADLPLARLLKRAGVRVITYN